MEASCDRPKLPSQSTGSCGLGTSTVEFTVCIVFSAATATFPQSGINEVHLFHSVLPGLGLNNEGPRWLAPPTVAPLPPSACDLGDGVAPGLSVAPPAAAAAVTPSDPEQHHLQAEEAR